MLIHLKTKKHFIADSNDNHLLPKFCPLIAGGHLLLLLPWAKCFLQKWDQDHVWKSLW